VALRSIRNLFISLSSASPSPCSWRSLSLPFYMVSWVLCARRSFRRALNSNAAAIDLLAPVMVLYFALIIHRLPIGAATKQFVVYAIIYCALMAPWWMHNYRAYGVS